MAPAKSYSDRSLRQVLKAGDEQCRILSVDNSHRTALSLLPILLGDDRAMTSLMIELYCHLVPGVHLDPVDRRIDPPPSGSRMITKLPEPIYGPPSFRCQCGTGNLLRSTASPTSDFLRKSALWTCTGFRSSRPSRSAIHALSASNGLSVGSIPSAKAARCTLFVALVKIRNPVGYPFIWSNNKAGQSGSAAATSVMPPISRYGSAPTMRRSASSRSTSSIKLRRSI
jgi:hypothetical protein